MVVIAVIVIAMIATIGVVVVLIPELTPAEEGLSGELTIAGSTTVLPINQECARLFMEKNPALRISVSCGGSGHGVKTVGAGEIDIGASSRQIKPAEWDSYPDLKPVWIAKDSVAIAVHPNNPITDLTMKQVAKIFAGEITNWQEIGGENKEIRVITREEGSGTRGVFEDYVLERFRKELTAEAVLRPSNYKVRAEIIGNEKSIGYLSFGYLIPPVKTVKINGMEPTAENVLADKYPIVRRLYLITKGEASDLERAFIDFVLSEKGQEIVEEKGFIRIK